MKVGGFGRFFAMAIAASAAVAQTQHIARVGVRPDGRQIGPAVGSWFASWTTSLSDDGRFVIVGETSAQQSTARLLDRADGSMAEFASGLGGAPPNNSGIAVALVAGDGSCIAFGSDSDNLVSGDAGVDRDVFWLERSTGLLLRVSIGLGAEPDSSSTLRAISEDGRFVTFDSEASNLVVNDANAASDVFRFDTATGQLERVSVATGGSESAGHSYGGALSFDGRYVAFSNNGDDLTPGDGNGSEDVYVRDLVAGTTQLISVSSAGALGDSTSAYASISRDGRFVAFESDAANLVPNDNNGAIDAFLRDRMAGTTVRLDVSSSGAEANSSVWSGILSGDGRSYVFVSDASDLVAADTNGRFDLFLRDVVAGTTVRLNTTPTGGENTQTNWFSGIEVRAVSNDGRFVAIDSHFADLVAGDSNSAWDAFVVDRVANVAPVTSYCTAKITSSGCLPAITSAGAPRATGWDSFWVSASQLPANVNGAFTWSLSPAAVPFGGGTQCVGPVKHIVRALNSGAYGGTPGFCSQGQLVFKVTQAFLAANGIAAGTTVYGQFLCRDGGFAQPNNFGLSDGIRFTVAP
jgi:Tol biopolymer transport system component